MMGKRLQEEGPSYPVHKAFYKSMKKSKHQVVVIENVPEYKDELVKQCLGSSWTVMTTRVDPRSLGFGSARRLFFQVGCLVLSSQGGCSMEGLDVFPKKHVPKIRLAKD